MSDTNTFNEFYDGDGFSYSDKPSPELAEYLQNSDLTGGKALDVGAGDGRNSLYLAELGFDVTAVDASRTGLEKLSEFARDRGLCERIRTVTTDARDFDYGESGWDLITSVTLFDHLEPDDVRPVFNRVVAGLKDNGLLHVKVHTVDDPGFTGEKRPESECAEMIQYYFRRNELLSLVQPLGHVLWYSEQREKDTTHGEPHFHSFAKLIARKLSRG